MGSECTQQDALQVDDVLFGTVAVERAQDSPADFLMLRKQVFPSEETLLQRLTVLGKLSRLSCSELALPVSYSCEGSELHFKEPYHPFRLADYLRLMAKKGKELEEEQVWYLVRTVLFVLVTCERVGVGLPEINSQTLHLTRQGCFCVYAHLSKQQHSLEQALASTHTLVKTAAGEHKCSESLADFLDGLRRGGSLAWHLNRARRQDAAKRVRLLVEVCERIAIQQMIYKRMQLEFRQVQKASQRLANE